MTKMTNNDLAHDFYHTLDLNNSSDTMSKSQIDSMLVCLSYSTIVAARRDSVAVIEYHSLSNTTSRHTSLLRYACTDNYVEIRDLHGLIESLRTYRALSNSAKIAKLVTHVAENNDNVSAFNMPDLLSVLDIKQPKNMMARLVKAQEKELKRLKKITTIKVNEYLDAKGDSHLELSHIKKQIKTHGIKLNIKRAKTLKKLIADNRAASIQRNLGIKESQRLDLIDRIKAGKIHDLKVINQVYPPAFWDIELIKSIVDNNINRILLDDVGYHYLNEIYLAENSELEACKFYNKYKSLSAIEKQYEVEFVRLVNDSAIITTRGNRIQLRKAKALFNAYSAGKDIVGIILGQYAVLQANSDTITIDCHIFSAEGLRYFFNNVA